METQATQAETETDADKTMGIVAYLTLIGLIVAFVVNKDKKDAFTTYHIKQSLGLCVLGFGLFLIGLIPFLGWILSFIGTLFLLYLWIMGLINAINGKVTPVPFFGRNFEEWFQNL